MNISDIIFRAVSIALVALVTYIVVPLIKKAGTALTERIEQKTKSEKLAEAVGQASDIVAQVVAATAQTYVDDLKKRGEFDADAQKQALEMAKEAALSLISQEAQQLIGGSFNSFADWLISAIEAAVANNKGAGKT